MTYEFEYFLQLMGAASMGKKAPPPTKDLNWDTVFELAKQQQILPLICHAVRDNPPSNSPDVRSLLFASLARKGSTIALLEEMHNSGIPSCVVKGFAASQYYAEPDYRISGDTDIIIDLENEERAYAFLKEHGFSIKPRPKNEHHGSAIHPEIGTLEIHVSLYGRVESEIWFENTNIDTLIQEPKQAITTPDGTYWTLGPTDHLIFMALHMIKHFIYSGMCVRMMTDVALTIANGKDLDIERFWAAMSSLKYETLTNAILWATIKYCGFPSDRFPGIGDCNESHTQLILDDLEAGGFLGEKAEAERKPALFEYNRQIILSKRSKAQYPIYMLKWLNVFRLKALFPEREYLSKKYPCVQRYPFLVPFVWIYRIFFVGIPNFFHKVIGKKDIQKTDDIIKKAKERVDMFKSLDML